MKSSLLLERTVWNYTIAIGGSPILTYIHGNLLIKIQKSIRLLVENLYLDTIHTYTRKLGAFHVTIELDEIELGLSQLCLNSFEKSWSITLHCAELRAAEFSLKKKIALPFHHMHIITYTGVLVCDLLNVLLQMVKVDFFFWFGLYQVTTITTCPACWVVHRIVSKFGLNHQTKKSYWANRGHKILWSFTHTPSGFQQQKQNTYVLSR